MLRTRRNALAEIEFRQWIGIKGCGDRVVDEIDCTLHGGQQEYKRRDEAIEKSETRQRQQNEDGEERTVMISIPVM